MPDSRSNEHVPRSGWRPWSSILDALPPLAGQTILDLGCGAGDQAAEIVARGARVIGIDMNEALIRQAQCRQLSNAEFRIGDLRTPPEVGVAVDGFWCSFVAAYFPDLPAALAAWASYLHPTGWVMLAEVDDLFGHEPLSARTKALFESYARNALVAGRYDFQMGRKLREYLEQSGFMVSRALTLPDRELAFDGPASPEVVDAWRSRIDRMTLLRGHCGAYFEPLREEFLGCLTHPDHRSLAKVHCCIATRPTTA